MKKIISLFSFMLVMLFFQVNLNASCTVSNNLNPTIQFAFELIIHEDGNGKYIVNENLNLRGMSKENWVTKYTNHKDVKMADFDGADFKVYFMDSFSDEQIRNFAAMHFQLN